MGGYLNFDYTIDNHTGSKIYKISLAKSYHNYFEYTWWIRYIFKAGKYYYLTTQYMIWHFQLDKNITEIVLDLPCQKVRWYIIVYNKFFSF